MLISVGTVFEILIRLNEVKSDKNVELTKAWRHLIRRGSSLPTLVIKLLRVNHTYDFIEIWHVFAKSIIDKHIKI